MNALYLGNNTLEIKSQKIYYLTDDIWAKA